MREQVDESTRTGSLVDIFGFYVLWAIVDIVIFVSLRSFGKEIVNANAAYFLLMRRIIILAAFLLYLAWLSHRIPTSIPRMLQIDLNLKMSREIVFYLLVTLVLALSGVLISFEMSSGTFSGLIFAARGPHRILANLITANAFGLIILVPINEEIAYRGFTYPILRRRFGLRWGIIITSLLFAVPQMTGQKTILLFPFFVLGGVFLNIVYEKERNLSWSIIFHSLYNLLIIAFAK